MSQRPCVPFDLAAAVEESRALIEAADAAREERARGASLPFVPVVPYVRHDAGLGPTESWDPVAG